MSPIKGPQIPDVITTFLVLISPLSVFTPVTRPFSISKPMAGVSVNVFRAPLSLAVSTAKLTTSCERGVTDQHQDPTLLLELIFRPIKEIFLWPLLLKLI